MRYLRKFLIFRPPAPWQSKADKAYQELMTKTTDKERLEYIKANEGIWQDHELKEALMEVSWGKCWYCETKLDRDDYHVDHFRPKAEIRYGTARHEKHTPGYWWLAFDWHNYRLACRYCNTLNRGTRRQQRARGKGEWFPLVDENNRVRDPEPNGFLINELPLLLDPTVPSDPGFLMFLEETGQPIPAEKEEERSTYQRAKHTIELLNLEDGRIVRSRVKLWHICRQLILEGNEAYKAYCSGSGPGYTLFKNIVKQLEEMAQEDHPYSAAVRSFLRNNEEKYSWLKCIP